MLTSLRLLIAATFEKCMVAIEDLLSEFFRPVRRAYHYAKVWGNKYPDELVLFVCVLTCVSFFLCWTVSLFS